MQYIGNSMNESYSSNFLSTLNANNSFTGGVLLYNKSLLSIMHAFSAYKYLARLTIPMTHFYRIYLKAMRTSKSFIRLDFRIIVNNAKHSVSINTFHRFIHFLIFFCLLIYILNSDNFCLIYFR